MPVLMPKIIKKGSLNKATNVTIEKESTIIKVAEAGGVREVAVPCENHPPFVVHPTIITYRPAITYNETYTLTHKRSGLGVVHSIKEKESLFIFMETIEPLSLIWEADTLRELVSLNDLNWNKFLNEVRLLRQGAGKYKFS